MISKKDFRDQIKNGIRGRKRILQVEKKKNSWIHLQWKNAHKFEGKRPEANIWKDNESHETNY